MDAESRNGEGSSKPRSLAETRQDSRVHDDGDAPQHPPLRAALLMVSVVAVIVLLSAVDLVR